MINQTSLILDVLVGRADVDVPEGIDPFDYDWFTSDVTVSGNIPAEHPVIACEYGTWFGILNV